MKNDENPFFHPNIRFSQSHPTNAAHHTLRDPEPPERAPVRPKSQNRTLDIKEGGDDVVLRKTKFADFWYPRQMKPALSNGGGFKL